MECTFRLIDRISIRANSLIRAALKQGCKQALLSCPLVTWLLSLSQLQLRVLFLGDGSLEKAPYTSIPLRNGYGGGLVGPYIYMQDQIRSWASRLVTPESRPAELSC